MEHMKWCMHMGIRKIPTGLSYGFSGEVGEGGGLLQG